MIIGAQSEKTYKPSNPPQTLSDTIVFYSNHIIKSASFLKQKYDAEIKMRRNRMGTHGSQFKLL